ncbi:MAG: hypothetical protein QWI73_05170 [Alphaproteobacteria bacterium]|nr:hypothetical protein [Alphaproteobacteria bacterium]
MRYTEIIFPKVLGLNQQINGVEEPNFLKRISFKYEGKSACIYKKHDDVKSALSFCGGNKEEENAFLLYRIDEALSYISHIYDDSSRKNSLMYHYTIEIGYWEMIGFQCRALITRDEFIERPREIILSYVSLLKKKLFICLSIKNDVVEKVDLDCYEI